MISIRFLLTLFIFAAGVVCAAAQPAPAGPEAENSNAIEEQAYLVLEDVITGTQALKLPQNRSRLQLMAAVLLWKRDQTRARSLFSDAAANVVEQEKQISGSPDRVFDQNQSLQLRQELVLTAARHDPALAYELFQRTRQPKAGPESEAYLEQLLLTQTIETNPHLALRKAEAMLDRGEYSFTIAAVLEKLQEQNKTGAARLTEKILGRLQPDTLLTNYGATSLALGILRAEPRTSEPGVSMAAYRQLLETVVITALKATPNKQDNARDLLLNLRPLLPQIEQHMPARAQAMRQKISELYNDNKSRPGMDQLIDLPQQGTLQPRNDNLDELRQKLEVTSDHDRVSLLLQLSEATKTDNPKQSRQLLDEAFGLVTRPATSYKQLDDQLQVAHVFGAIEPLRSFDLLESGINKLNELLSAAAALSGFEVHIFKRAEMPLPGSSKLGVMVIRYGQELAILAKSDFSRALSTAEQFQYPESRLFARLSIVQAVLGRE